MSILNPFSNPSTPSVSLDVYSTEEKRIGTWIDGKPLYRKVASFTTLGKNVEGAVYTFDANMNVVQCGGYFNSLSNNKMPLCFFGDAESHAVGYVNDTQHAFYMKISHTNYANKPGVLILEYTKTTDEPETTT